jgi:hypothetical protein
MTPRATRAPRVPRYFRLILGKRTLGRAPLSLHEIFGREACATR